MQEQDETSEMSEEEEQENMNDVDDAIAVNLKKKKACKLFTHVQNTNKNLLYYRD